MKEERQASWPIPTTTGQFLDFEGARMPLYELDGLLWIVRDDVEAAICVPFTRYGHWYTRNLGVWATRVAWMEQPSGAWKSVRLLSLYAAQALAKRSAEPKAMAFVEWADVLLNSHDAPAGLRVDLWKPPTDP